jgi:hypothetical protein
LVSPTGTSPPRVGEHSGEKDNSVKTYAQIRATFKEGGHSWFELNQTGWAGVCLLGGRVMAFAFAEEEETLLFISPEIDNLETLRRDPVSMIGGPGGDRLWFAPEFAFKWEGSNPDVEKFSNYRVQRNEDPGHYQVKVANDSIQLSMQTSLTDLRDGGVIQFRVTRSLSPTANPLVESSLSKGLRYAGYELHHRIEVLEPARNQRIGLWHLLQVPVGSVLIVPTRGFARPLKYFNEGAWEALPDHFRWKYGGTAIAKIGLDVTQVTGRTAILRQLQNEEWVLMVRQFPIAESAYYCGFGEMEYHSPGVGAPPLPPAYSETSWLWAFGGDQNHIQRVAATLLDINIASAFGS